MGSGPTRPCVGMCRYYMECPEVFVVSSEKQPAHVNARLLQEEVVPSDNRRILPIEAATREGGAPG